MKIVPLSEREFSLPKLARNTHSGGVAVCRGNRQRERHWIERKGRRLWAMGYGHAY